MFRALDPQNDLASWRRLLRSSAPDLASFRGLASQQERIFRSDYVLLKRRFVMRRFGLFSDSGELVACAIHFRARNIAYGPKSTLGGLLFDPELNLEDVKNFARNVLAETGSVDVAPMNGHMNLGLSHPAPATSPSNITFMCAPHSKQTDIFLRHTGSFEIAREQYALITEITDELQDKVKQGIIETKSRGFDSRPLSVLNYKRDIMIYNDLINKAMTGHPNFYPLTFEEEWDIMREGLAIFLPSWFRFLTHHGREIGVCFAVPDYNFALNSERSDIANIFGILKQRVRGRWPRARLVYSAVHPEYQGLGLFKAVRYRVIQAMIESGVREFESSYVDETNVNSLSNVRSTGGRVSHSFHLFRSRPWVLGPVEQTK